MAREYPHISDTAFPHLDTVDVYKYQNEVPYDEYREGVRIKLMHVPWFSNYDDAVYFDDKETRDDWFENHVGISKTMPTMFRLYSDGSIKVDEPVDDCMKYNYVMIDYGMLPEQSEFSANRRMFYFIDSMVQASPTTTTLYLSVDYWNTYIYDMGISYVNLVRGHAPMAETDIDSYLADPLNESEFMLTDDVSYGTLQRVMDSEALVFNDGSSDNPTVLGFLSSADLEASWANGIPVQNYYTDSQYANCIDLYTVDFGDGQDFETFKTAVNTNHPEFWLTVKAIFLIPKKLLTVSNTFSFCGYTCHNCDTVSDKESGFWVPTVEKYGYPDNIKWIPKLYTYPYSAIEVNDFKGNTYLVKLEETCGELEVHTLMTDIYPFLSVEAYMVGIGSDEKLSVSFKNMYTETFTIGGRSYEHPFKWSIPVMGVQLTVEQAWVLQNKLNADAVYDNAVDNADLEYDLAYNSSKITDAAKEWHVHTNNTMYGLAGKEAAYNYALQNVAATAARDCGVNQGGINLITAAGSSLVAGAMSGGVAGAGLAAAGTVFNGINYAMASTNNVTALNTTQTNDASMLMLMYGGSGIDGTLLSNINVSSIQDYTPTMSGFKGLETTALNTQTSATMGNSQKNQLQSGLLQQAFAKGGTVYSQSLAMPSGSSSIIGDMFSGTISRSYNAQHDQCKITNPPEYGQMTGTPEILSKPFGVTFNVVTQSKNAIRAAAEQFLRYGYNLNMQWNVDSLKKMTKFTYWQADAVYGTGNVYEGARQVIRSIFNKGVTVWNDPDDIGNTSIYENEVSNE